MGRLLAKPRLRAALVGAGAAVRRPGAHRLARPVRRRGAGGYGPVRQRGGPLPVPLLRAGLSGGGTGSVPVPGAAAPSHHGTPVPGERRLCRRPGPGLCGGLSRGGPHRHSTLSAGAVLQDRGRAAAGLLQQQRPRLYSGGGGGRGVRQRQSGAGPLSVPHGRLSDGGAALPVLSPREGPSSPAGWGSGFRRSLFPPPSPDRSRGP